MAGPIGRVKVTLNQKVLVHLLPYVRFADAFDAPDGVTQQGIATALRVRRSHVTLVLQALVRQGVAVHRTMRIRGEQRRKRAYFLTPYGYARAREAEATLAAMPVVLGGSGTEVVLGRAPERLGGAYTLRDLLACLRPDGVLDSTPLRDVAGAGN